MSRTRRRGKRRTCKNILGLVKILCVIDMSRKNIVLTKALNCNVSGLYQNSTNNGRTGYKLTKAVTNRRLGTVYNVTKGLKRIRPGMAKLGSGVQGIVYLASTTSNGRKNIVIKVSPKDRGFTENKQPSKVEYTIQKALYKIVPNHIPVPYKFIHCRNFVPASEFSTRKPTIYNYDDQFVMYSEYAHGGPLKDWLHKMGTKLTDTDMARIIRQVVSTLKKIHSKYPEFRHNDLHLGNIFVDDTGSFPRIMLADFGLSRLKATGSNPVINNGHFINSGISSRTSVKYDVHYFINCIDHELRYINSLPRTKLFIDRMLPSHIRGANTANVRAFRLKNGVSNASAPSFDKVLDDPFIRRASANNSPVRNLSSPRVSVVNRNRNAAEIARNALANIPGVKVTTSARRPTAAEFLRMSPRSRAALRTRSRANVTGESRSVVVRNVMTGKGAPVVRNTIRRVGMGVGVRRLPFGTGSSRVTVPKTKNSPVRPARNSPPTAMPARNSPPTAIPAPAMTEAESRFIAMPTMTGRERTRIARDIRDARAASKRIARARRGSAPRRVSPSSTNRAMSLLSKYVNGIENQRTLTRRMMKEYLTRAGYSSDRANAVARNYEQSWITNRGNVKSAMRSLANGKNLNKLGFPSYIKNLAERRSSLKLTNIPNGRIRSKGRLLSGFKKDELLAMARTYRITANAKMTKDQIISALFG